MNSWILLIVLTSLNGNLTTSQLGPYDSEAQCRKIRDVVDHALPVSSFATDRGGPESARIRGKTLVCTLGRNI